MLPPTTTRQIRINRRGLIELALASATLPLLTLVAWWTWRTGSPTGAIGDQVVGLQALTVALIRQQPAIMLSILVAFYCLLLALTLAMVPPIWWLRTPHDLAEDATVATTPVKWMQQRMGYGTAQAAAQSEQAAGDDLLDAFGVKLEQQDEAGLAAPPVSTTPQPTVGAVPSDPPPPEKPPAAIPQLPENSVTPPAQANGKPDRASQPADAAGQSDKAQQKDSATPQAVQEEPSLLDALQEDPDDDPLAELDNIGEILSQAFEIDEIDPALANLAGTLDEVNIISLVELTQETAVSQGPARGGGGRTSAGWRTR